MGNVVEAKCTCGYTPGKLFLGGGQSNFKTDCSFPNLCLECKNLFIGNMKVPFVVCSQCDSSSVLPYDDPSLIHNTGLSEDSWVFSQELYSLVPVARFLFFKRKPKWEVTRKLMLTNEKYLCPKCDNFELTFKFFGLWD